MTAATTASAADPPAYHDDPEVEPLKLKAEHFPLPCSLLRPVLQRYTDLESSAADEQPMDQGELLDYIKNIENLELSPLDAVLAQTDAIGDPALPSIEQVAILRWLGAAQQEWEAHYPLEEPLASQLLPLRRLAAALAVSDPDFLTPGAHPIHRILDTIQEAAIGWQPRLGRAGQALERQVTRVVESAQAWFDDRETNLESICSVIVTAAERDRERTQRMVQRVVETEQGRVKTAEAKLTAAGMINDALREFQAPVGIGEFLKGPWYASAQLVLLKYGADSEEWQQMSTTTHTLLDTLQIHADAGEERRQYVTQAVTQLPRDLRRWLLNLHHDSEAVDDAVGMVEFAHLRVLRNQPLDVAQIDTIPVDGNNDNPREADPPEALDGIEVGQWFSVNDEEGPLRAQLVLKLEQEQQLLFTNHAGIKVLQQGYEEFARAIADNRAKPLHSGASFSVCLASAAGISTEENLDALLGASAAKARHQQEEAERLQQEQEEAERLQQEQEEAERLQREQEEAERLRKEQEEAEPRPPGPEEAERLRKEQEEAAWLKEQVDKFERLQWEQEEAERLQREQEEAERAQREREAAERETWTEEEREAWHAAEDERLEREWEKARLEQEQQQRDEMERARESRGATLDGLEDVELNLPMGAWLGFHDGDTPLLAKLAVHDREKDQYYFVNREGIKLRQLSKQELLTLIDRGLVDIMQANTNFRDEVTRIRSESQE